MFITALIAAGGLTDEEAGTDIEAYATMLLASARLVREPLPIDQVARHYNSGEPQQPSG